MSSDLWKRDVRAFWVGMAMLAACVVLLTVLPAHAGGVTARIRKATCDRPTFPFVVENSTARYRKFTVVLYNADGPGEHLFLRDKVPAWGGMAGTVNPDWDRRNFYMVEAFRSWEWRPWNHEWRVKHWLAGASARLECDG